MKKLLVLGLVLCFASAASAATITISGTLNAWGNWDADANTNYMLVEITIPVGVTLAGLDMGITTPAGATVLDDVEMKSVLVNPGPPPQFQPQPIGVDLMSAYGWADDRESWIADGLLDAFIVGNNLLTGGGADGIVAYSGEASATWPYTYDNATVDYTTDKGWIAGGSTSGIVGTGVPITLAALGYDGLSATDFAKLLPLIAEIGPGGIAVAQGSDPVRAEDVVFINDLTLIPEPTTMLLLLAGVVGLIRRKK